MFNPCRRCLDPLDNLDDIDKTLNEVTDILTDFHDFNPQSSTSVTIPAMQSPIADPDRMSGKEMAQVLMGTFTMCNISTCALPDPGQTAGHGWSYD